MQITDEQIWDNLGIIADGTWTVADLWDRARLLGVRPSQLLRACPHRSTAAAA